MTASEELSALCWELEGVAEIFGAIGDTNRAAELCGAKIIKPHLVYRTRLGPTRLKLVMEPTKAAILAKIEKLKEAYRAIRWATKRPANRKPSLSVAGFNQAVADRFIKDGETQNAREYNALYGH
jgi:hypothetical protein